MTIQTTFQDTVLSLAATAGDSDARRLAATVMLRFKVLQGEEEAYLARLARRSKDPRETQRQCIRQPGRADPGAWAPYVLIE